VVIGEVAVATCRAQPGIDPDDAPVVAALRRRQLAVCPVVWDDQTVDWSGFDLTVIRSTWDYTGRRDDFLTWTRTVPRLANPADIVESNTDKRYLATLADAGVPVVPTGWVVPGEVWQPPDAAECVIKPAVSAGSRDTGRYDLTRPDHRASATALVRRLQAAGRVVMVQPYLDSVDEHGETALMYFGGRFSHAVGKGAMLTGPYQGLDTLYKPERITPRTPTFAEREVADAVLAACGVADRLLYARVDLIPGPDGPLLVELELTEPSVFLRYDRHSAERFADAIATVVKG
jgi:hypothetical protein